MKGSLLGRRKYRSPFLPFQALYGVEYVRPYVPFVILYGAGSPAEQSPDKTQKRSRKIFFLQFCFQKPILNTTQFDQAILSYVLSFKGQFQLFFNQTNLETSTGYIQQTQ